MLENYKPKVLERVTAKYAETIISEKDLDNLEWANDFINRYRKKYKKLVDIYGV